MLKIAVKKKLLTDKMNRLILNSPKNVIDLDNEDNDEDKASDDDPIDNQMN